MAGTACILFVLAIRLLLRRKPRSFSYVLWAVVFLRLLCPFSLSSPYFGLMLGGVGQALESAAYRQETVQYQMLIHKDGTVETLAGRKLPGTPESREFSAQYGTETLGNGDGAGGNDRGFSGSLYQNAPVNRRYTRSEVLRLERSWVTLCSLAWAAGAAALLGYSLLSYLLLRRRMRQAVRVQEDVYESERIDTPFLLGILDPRIYLPMGLSEEERAYVLAHELAHLRRGDYLVKLVTWLALSLHWFNPLVWLAYGLMSRDMEMSCDERVIRRLGEGSKKAYSQTLLSISGRAGGARERRSAAPLSFGEEDIGGRVKNILAYRGVKTGTAVALAVVMGAAGLVLLTDRREMEENSSASGTDSQSYSENPQMWAGVDESDREDTYYLPEEAGQLEERISDPWEAYRKMDREAPMTWEQLQALAEKKNPGLEDYAGYQGAEWEEENSSLTAYLTYFLQDPDTGLDYWLGVCYWKEDGDLDSVYLRRESDGDTRLLYRDRGAEGIYRYTEIEDFRRDIHSLEDWVSGWEMPHEEQVQVGAYLADLSVMGGGVLFTWKEEERNLEDAWAPEAWKGAGGFARTENTETAPFLFDREGRLTDLQLGMNHTSPNGPAEVLEGCEEQAVLVSLNHDLYTVAELDALQEAGRPVPEEESTADFWYIGFAREDAPYGYVLFLAQRYYTREEAVRMARSIRFTGTAWEPGDASY